MNSDNRTVQSHHYVDHFKYKLISKRAYAANSHPRNNGSNLANNQRYCNNWYI